MGTIKRIIMKKTNVILDDVTLTVTYEIDKVCPETGYKGGIMAHKVEIGLIDVTDLLFFRLKRIEELVFEEIN